MLSSLKSHLLSVQWDAIFRRLPGKADPKPLRRGSETEVGPKTLVLKGRINLRSLNCVGKSLIAMDAAISTFLVVPGRCRKVGKHLRGPRPKRQELHSGLRHQSTNLEDVESKDIIWEDMTNPLCSQANPNLHGLHSLSPGTISEHKMTQNPPADTRVEPTSLHLIDWSRNFMFTLGHRG